MLLAVVTISLTGCGRMGLPSAGPPDVELVEVVQRDVPITKDWVATLDGLVLRFVPRAGLLIRQNYTNGGFVRKGEQLFEVDPRLFQAHWTQLREIFSRPPWICNRPKRHWGRQS